MSKTVHPVLFKGDLTCSFITLHQFVVSHDLGITLEVPKGKKEKNWAQCPFPYPFCLIVIANLRSMIEC